jgi:hypothetical protein
MVGVYEAYPTYSDTEQGTKGSEERSNSTPFLCGLSLVRSFRGRLIHEVGIQEVGVSEMKGEGRAAGGSKLWPSFPLPPA